MYVCLHGWMYVCIYYAHWFLKQTALKQDLSTVGRPVGCMHAKAQRLDVHECLHMTMIDLIWYSPQLRARSILSGLAQAVKLDVPWQMPEATHQSKLTWQDFCRLHIHCRIADQCWSKVWTTEANDWSPCYKIGAKTCPRPSTPHGWSNSMLKKASNIITRFTQENDQTIWGGKAPGCS